MSLTRDEYNTLILGSDVCRIFLLTQGHLTNWALYDILLPTDDNFDCCLSAEQEDYHSYKYKLGECVNAALRQGEDKEKALSIAKQFIYGTVPQQSIPCPAKKEPAPQDDKAGQGESDTQAKIAQRIYTEIDRLGSINTKKAKSLWEHCTVYMKVWYEGKKKGDMITQYDLDKSKGIRRAKEMAEKYLYDSTKGPQIEPRLHIVD